MFLKLIFFIIVFQIVSAFIKLLKGEFKSQAAFWQHVNPFRLIIYWPINQIKSVLAIFNKLPEGPKE